MPVVLFLFVLSVYLRTCCGLIYWKDSGELVSAVSTMGICHPSGYPVYTVVGWLFTRLPAGDIAFRLNLMSVVAGAAVSIAVFCFLRRAGLPVPGAAGGAMLPMFAHEIWLQSSVTEIYSFSLLLFTLAAMFLAGRSVRDLHLGVFCLGLATAHHLTTVLLLPAYAVLSRHHLRALSVRTAGSVLLAGILAGSSLLYLPVRSHRDPPADFGDPETLATFANHIRTQHYESKMWPETLEPVLKRTGVIGMLMVKQYGPGLAAAGITGIVILLLSQSWRVFTILFAGAHCAFLLYPPDHSFLIPLILLLGIAAVLALNAVREILVRIPHIRPAIRRSLEMLLVFGPVLVLLNVNYAFVDKSAHRAAWDYSRRLLGDLPSDAVVLTGGDNGFSLVRYARMCEGYRTDVIHVHRPMITWPNHLPRLVRRFPDWLAVPSRLESEIEAELMQVHPEAATARDHARYVRLAARLSGRAAVDHPVFWEGGSDVSGFYRHLVPEGILYRFSLRETTLPLGDGLTRYWIPLAGAIENDTSLLLDHNAVSEYAVVLYNLSGYCGLHGDRSLRQRFALMAERLWRIQLDADPHNELVEGMSELIGGTVKGG